MTCYESDSLQSFGLRVASITDNTGDRADRAVENCAAAWSHGLVREGAPPLNEAGYPVPPLTACRGPFDEVVVFPDDAAAVCQSNGLKRFDSGN